MKIIKRKDCHLDGENLINTPSGPLSAYKFCLKSKYLYFDQTYRKNYQHLQCQINIVWFIMKCSFIVNIFGIVDVDIF